MTDFDPNNYQKFVRHYGGITRPLTTLLRKDQFQWGQEAAEAFLLLRKAMTTVPVLAMPDFNLQFVVESDASGVGLGAVLMQNQQPIAFFSHALTERQKQKSVYERELMAIVFAIQEWRHYLLGRKFVVRTDQKSLCFLMEQREVNLEYQRWLTKILGFDFDIVYKLGLENRAADALSRKVEVKELYAVSVSTALQLEEISSEVDKDPELQKIISEWKQDPAKQPEFSVVQGRLLRQGKLVVPKGLALIGVIMREYHDGKMGGHGGVLKTQKRIADLFYWVGMLTDIRRFVASCQTCQRQKYSTLAPGGLLQRLPVSERVWEDVSMDFVEGLPRSKGLNSVMVVVDRLTKFSHFVGLSHPYKATDVVVFFIQDIVKIHGFPRTIVSDRDKIFTSLFWKELFRLSGTKLCFSTAYHPQTDGQTEVTNRGMETYLRCFAGDKPKTWASYLAWAELSYNSSHHSTLNMTPFRALYGRDLPTLIKYENGSTSNAALEEQLKDRDATLKLLREHLHCAQQLMKQRADKSRREVELAVGELVYVKLWPYRQKSLARKVNEKLCARFYGPFEVEARVGQVAYKLKLPSDSKIHPTFHISQLKKAVGEPLEVVPIPLQLTSEAELVVEPEGVLSTRINAQSGQEELLIKWKGLPSHESTWEWKSAVKEKFGGFDLEDKVNFIGASNDTWAATHPPVLYHYSRKARKE